MSFEISAFNNNLNHEARDALAQTVLQIFTAAVYSISEFEASCTSQALSAFE